MSPEGSTVIIDAAAKAALGRKASAKSLQSFARELETGLLRKGRTFGCLVTVSEDIRTLNARFRRKNEPTDVLSFPSGDKEGFIGDIAISSELAIEQARENGHSCSDEIRILMLHGVLHLMGQDTKGTRERWRAPSAAGGNGWVCRLD